MDLVGGRGVPLAGGVSMAVNFQNSEIEAAWAEVFSKDEYRIAIAEVANSYPQ